MPENERPTPHRLDAPLLVYNRKTFGQMINHLRHQSVLALDTESDSLYKYYPRVCLLQITAFSSADAADPSDVVDYLVDPLRLDNLNGLEQLLADPGMEVVMHAAENDILSLQREFDFQFAQLFDTQLAFRILGRKKIGLAAILESEFGVVTDKRMQRTNWGNRPLTPQQITYAQVDTHFLLLLRQQLIDELKGVRRWDEAQAAFAALLRTDFKAMTLPERTFWNMKSSRSIPREDSGVLEALWLWREKEAQRQNRPPFKIMGEQVLVKMAKQRPQDVDEMSTIHGLSKNQIRRYGSDLLRVVEEGAQRPLPQQPQSNGHPEKGLTRPERKRFAALRTWRTNLADQRGVAPDIIFSNELLLQIARRAPGSQAELDGMTEIDAWKAENYGAEILRLVNKQ